MTELDVDQGEGEADEASIAARGLVLAQDDAGVVFNLTEQVLDPVPGPIPLAVVRDLDLAVALGGDDHLDAALGAPSADGIGVVAAIADQPLELDPVEQRFGARAIGGLARR